MPKRATIDALIRYYRDLIDVQRYSGKSQIFKPTAKIVLAASELRIPKDEPSFENFVKNLHILFWEGSGYGKRLCLDCDDEKVVEKLKELRHHYSHDREQDDKVDKKFLKIGDIFEYLIGRRFPADQKDWTSAGNKLISNLLAFSNRMLKKLASGAVDAVEVKDKFFTKEFFEHEVVLFPDKKEKFRITRILEKELRTDSFLFLPTFHLSLPAEFGNTHSAVYLTSEATWADMDGFQSFLREVEKKWTERNNFEFYPDSRLMPWSISGMQSGEIVYGSGSESLIAALAKCYKTIQATVTMVLQGIYGEDSTKTFLIVIGSDVKGGVFNYNFIDFYLSSAPLDWTWIRWFNDTLDKLSPFNSKATYYTLKPYGYFVWRSRKRIAVDKFVGGIGRNGFDNREWDNLEGIILSKKDMNVEFHLDKEQSWIPDFLSPILQEKCPNQYLEECLASVTNHPPTISELQKGKLAGINNPKLYMLAFEGKGWSIFAVNIWGTSSWKDK